MPAPLTPDRRYIAVRGRLWRAANPNLSEERRDALVKALMDARRRVRRDRDDPEGLQRARADVDKAKHGLGERGPVWWDDGSPDYNRHLIGNTPYAEWWAGLESVGTGGKAAPER